MGKYPFLMEFLQAKGTSPATFQDTWDIWLLLMAGGHSWD